jgi:hypothetical protein
VRGKPGLCMLEREYTFLTTHFLNIFICLACLVDAAFRHA